MCLLRDSFLRSFRPRALRSFRPRAYSMPLRPQISALLETVGAAPSVAARAGGFFDLSGGSPSDLPIGLAVAAAATWASVRLCRPAHRAQIRSRWRRFVALSRPGHHRRSGCRKAGAQSPAAAFSRFPCLSGAPASGPARNAFAVPSPAFCRASSSSWRAPWPCCAFLTADSPARGDKGG